MKKLKNIFLSPRTNLAAFILVVVLILCATIGVASAAISYITSTYSSQIKMYDIGVSLLENGERVSWRDYGSKDDGNWDQNIPGVLLGNMLENDGNVILGKAYTEELNVRNSGSINQYVRVSIYKYWVDPNKFAKDPENAKLSELDPDYIDLHLTNLDSAWLLDTSASTSERVVLYYNRLLNSGDVTPLFADTVTISNACRKEKAAYNGAQFRIEVHVDAVQENNAGDAILSAWGRTVAVDEESGTLSLN